MSVLVETTIGDLVIDLFLKERPKCCLNFLKLCKLKYYNYCLFHSIEENYMAQTGDPSGSGKGGESVWGTLYGDQARYFEMEENPKLRHRRKGLVSMVNNGNDMHGSQFFITLGDELDFLDGKHTVFGEVGEGMEIVEELNQSLCDDDHVPYRDIRILHTIVVEDPYDDLRGFQPPSRSPSPSIEVLKNSRIGVEEEVDEFEGKPEEQVHEFIEAKEATAQATILEMIGDIRHIDELPPDNVLFVCKLNPVTTEDDLEIIFSRFGPIKCCEIIKDKKTGNSLQYAFVEFQKPENCEDAYFKMDNVLIDDRRIHVDFSQSVAKNSQWQTRFKRDLTTKTKTDDAKQRGFPRSNEGHRSDRRDHRTERRDRGEGEPRDRKRERSRSRDKERKEDRDRRSRHGHKQDRHRDRRHGEEGHSSRKLHKHRH